MAQEKAQSDLVPTEGELFEQPRKIRDGGKVEEDAGFNGKVEKTLRWGWGGVDHPHPPPLGGGCLYYAPTPLGPIF